MAKKYIAFLSCFFLPMLFLGNGPMRASENDSILQQEPEIFVPPVALYISNTDIYISKSTEIDLSGDLTLNNADVTGHGRLILKSNPESGTSDKI